MPDADAPAPEDAQEQAPPDAPDEPVEIPSLVPIVEADSEPGEEDLTDRIEFVHAGVIRFRYSDGEKLRTFRIRRPFFGELKDLRLALEEMTDEISDRSIEIQQLGVRLQAEADALAKDVDLSDDARLEARRRIRTQDREAGRSMTALADESRIAWWGRVFTMLGVDGSPDPEWPAWIVDPWLPNRVLQHWRSHPLARGGR